MELNINDIWKEKLQTQWEEPYFKELMDFLSAEYQDETTEILPPKNQIFNALNACDFHDIKVVIVGQDPYPTAGHANGMAFSLNPDVKPLARSLVNIFKEINTDTGAEIPENGDLTRWANQGVLLLNDILTVRKGSPKSHKNRGWEQFTQYIIEKISQEKEGVVFMLWGANAEKKSKWIDGEKHLILKSGHPSPQSANRGKWFGNKHFSQANDYLISKGKQPIEWVILKDSKKETSEMVDLIKE